ITLYYNIFGGLFQLRSRSINNGKASLGAYTVTTLIGSNKANGGNTGHTTPRINGINNITPNNISALIRATGTSVVGWPYLILIQITNTVTLYHYILCGNLQYRSRSIFYGKGSYCQNAVTAFIGSRKSDCCTTGGPTLITQTTKVVSPSNSTT